MTEPTSREEVRRRLLAMMCEITQTDVADLGPVDDDTPCVGGDLLADSLDVLEFVVSLEREFGVSIRDSEVGQELLGSVGRLVDHVVAART